MTWSVFDIAAGTPFFHGTTRAVEVIKYGVKPSNATPAGKKMTGFLWFFSSFSPALPCTECATGQPAVVEFITTRPLKFADMRPYKSVLALSGPEPNAHEILQHGLAGVIIGATAGSHDYEYGFVTGSDLNYSGYELAPNSWNIAQELLWNLPTPEYSAQHEAWQRHNDSLRAEIERKLAKPD